MDDNYNDDVYYDDDPRLYNEWLVFHDANPHVYASICRFTNDVIRAGYTRFGMGAVWERVRWEFMIDTTDRHFKMPNNHRAYYSRHWLKQHPQFPKFFRIAMLRSRRKRQPVDRYGRPL